MAAALSMRALDESLLDSVSRITSTDADISSIKYCGCPIDSKTSSRKGRRSSARVQQHSPECPLFSVLKGRAGERHQIRAILIRFFKEMESSFSEMVPRAEAKRSYSKLLGTLDKLNEEKQHMELKMHRMRVSLVTFGGSPISFVRIHEI